jgi:hypothetical protein
MAKTIPQLTDATTVGAADELIIQQGGVTKRATATELFASEPFNATGINSGGISLFALQNNAASRKILRANPTNGGRIVIDGVMRQFQSGLTLDTTAYAASSLTPFSGAPYYVYAYWTGSAIALELSLTGYTLANNNVHAGLAIKTGDTSRTLVGLVWLDANKEIVNNAQSNNLINWYNQRLNFLAGQLGADVTPPDTWSQYAVVVTDRFDAANPDANWQEIGPDTENLIPHLGWAASLGRIPAVTFGISGSALIDGIGQRLQIRFGYRDRGPTLPVSSDMSITAGTNFCFGNVSGATTYGQGTSDARRVVTAWARIVGVPRAATGTHSDDTITCSGNTFQSNLPVRFLSLTGGAGLSANTRYFVREHSGSVGSTFKLSTSATFAATGASNIITALNHSFVNGNIVRFSGTLTGGSPLTTGTDYYVINVSGNTFQLSATSGGAALTFATITAATIGHPIIDFTSDISAASIDGNGATVYINTFGSYWG